MLKGASQAMLQVAELQSKQSDFRPKVFDKNTNKLILIDTGAAISVTPNRNPNAVPDYSKKLHAVNGTSIDTFGTEVVKFRLGERTFTHTMIVALVSSVVLGWDFMVQNRLDLKWTLGGQCTLKPPRGKTIQLVLGKADPHILSLSEISEPKSYKHYAQKTNKTESTAHTIPSAYRTLLNKYPDIHKPNFMAKPKHNVQHIIDTGSSQPCRAKVRPLLDGSPKAIMGEKKWKDLAKLGILEQVDPNDPTIWTSALHLVPKPDGDIRACGDFRPLNLRTVLDAYPLPNIRTFTNKLRGATQFSKLDMKSAYYQIELDRSSSLKTCVVTPWGTWRFKRLPLGLKNAGQTFQKVIDNVLSGLEGTFAYLDDILVWSEEPSQHMARVEAVLQRLHDNGLALNLDKCVFQQPAVEYLGFNLSKDGIAPLPRKVDVITGFPAPSKPKSLLGFLGALNYYRRCLPNIDGQSPATVLQPLYEAATKKIPGKTFKAIWEENELHKPFNKAKQMLIQACNLTHPDPACPIAITSDSSQHAIGAVLEQFSGNIWRPLGYWSRHLSADKQKWSTYRRETYALQQGLRHFHDDIAGRHVVAFTDHKPLVQAFSSDKPPQYDVIAQQHLYDISQWTNDVRFISGKSNVVADHLSRPEHVPVGTAYALPTDDLAAISTAFETVDHHALVSAQEQCQETVSHSNGLHPGGLSFQKVEFSPGVWLTCEMSTGKSRPFVPLPMRELIIRSFHQFVHPGQKATAKKIEDRYYWPHLKKDTSEYISRCDICLRTKAGRTIAPPVKNKPVLAPRFSDLEIDVVGPLPASEGMRYLLTVLCRTSRWVEAIPMAEATSASCCTAFVRGWVRTFGLPTTATSDNGGTFISKLWRDMHDKLGTIVTYTPPFHPASLGGVERQHRELKVGIKAALLEMGEKHASKWMEVLPWVLLARHTNFQPTLDASAADLVFGSPPKIPGDLLPTDAFPAGNPAELLRKLQQKVAKEPAQTQHHRQMPTYWPSSAAKATHVYILKGKPSPLGPITDGPYPIIQRLGDSCLQVRLGYTPGGEERLSTVHWNNCRPTVALPGAPEAQAPKRGRPSKKDLEAREQPQ